MGLEEIARKRGHRGVVAMVPREEGGVEMGAGLADRKQQTVAAFLRACTEMSEGCVNALTEDIPWAEIVIERFPGPRASRDCADTVRTQERKRLKRALAKAEEAEITGAMWPFRQQPGALKPAERPLLERVCRDSPPLQAADHLREDRTALVARADTKAGAKRASRIWCKRVRQRGLAECERFLGTLARWMEAITHSCQGRQTSGCGEGCNNRVKGLMRRC